MPPQPPPPSLTRTAAVAAAAAARNASSPPPSANTHRVRPGAKEEAAQGALRSPTSFPLALKIGICIIKRGRRRRSRRRRVESTCAKYLLAFSPLYSAHDELWKVMDVKSDIDLAARLLSYQVLVMKLIKIGLKTYANKTNFSILLLFLKLSSYAKKNVCLLVVANFFPHHNDKKSDKGFTFCQLSCYTYVVILCTISLFQKSSFCIFVVMHKVDLARERD